MPSNLTDEQVKSLMRIEGLPETYNQITEDADFFYINRRTDVPLFGAFPFHQIMVEMGLLDGRAYLRKLCYPKGEYTRERVEKIALESVGCPVCRFGTKLVHPPTQMHKYLGEKEDSVGIKEWVMNSVSGIASRLSLNPSELAMDVIGNTSAGIGGSIIDNIVPEGGNRVVKGIAGVMELGLSMVPSIPLPARQWMWKTSLPTLVAAIDISPEDLMRVQSFVSRVRSRMGSLGPMEALKQFIRPRFRGQMSPSLSSASGGGSLGVRKNVTASAFNGGRRTSFRNLVQDRGGVNQR